MIGKRTAVGIMLFQALLLILLGGAFMRAEWQNGNQQDEIEESIGTGRILIGCLVDYSVDLTNVLEDRDVVSSTTRQAAIEWLDAILEQSQNPSGSDSAAIIESLQVYRNTLVKLNHPKDNFDLPNYPDIKNCLAENDLPVPKKLEAAFKTVAYTDNPPRERCLGRRITIEGTPRNDIITGTTHSDVIWSKDGDDLINASQGRDRICGGFGGDIINGGPGLDRANGGPGTDVCLSVIIHRRCP